MKIVSMEPTPSPYSIKINENETLKDGEAENYTNDDLLTEAPEYVQQLFNYEAGDKTAIPALQQVLEDPEFEVRIQAKMALARIESGQEAEGSSWRQMANTSNKK